MSYWCKDCYEICFCKCQVFISGQPIAQTFMSWFSIICFSTPCWVSRHSTIMLSFVWASAEDEKLVWISRCLFSRYLLSIFGLQLSFATWTLCIKMMVHLSKPKTDLKQIYETFVFRLAFSKSTQLIIVKGPGYDVKKHIKKLAFTSNICT